MARHDLLELAAQGMDDGWHEADITVQPAGIVARVVVADTIPKRQHGLTDSSVTGRNMLFVWPEPVRAQFHMLGLEEPLEIAWFDGDGRFIEAAVMQPGKVGYGCPRPFQFALETRAGGLDALAVGPFSRITRSGVV